MADPSARASAAADRLVARRERHRRRQPARHVGGEARARQDRRQRGAGALRDHLGHEAVRAALDALGAGDDRRAGRELGRDRAGGRAQMLRRHRQQDGVVAPDRGGERRDADALVELQSRQPRALAPAHDVIGAGAVAGGEQHGTARARDHVRQRAAPGAGSHDGDAVECHGYAVVLNPEASPCASAVLRRGDLRQAGRDDVEDGHV